MRARLHIAEDRKLGFVYRDHKLCTAICVMLSYFSVFMYFHYFYFPYSRQCPVAIVCEKDLLSWVFLDFCHYNFSILEEYHYYLYYWKLVITIFHFFEACHFIRI